MPTIFHDVKVGTAIAALLLVPASLMLAEVLPARAKAERAKVPDGCVVIREVGPSVNETTWVDGSPAWIKENGYTAYRCPNGKVYIK